jgi:hypothetical protein
MQEPCTDQAGIMMILHAHIAVVLRVSYVRHTSAATGCMPVAAMLSVCIDVIIPQPLMAFLSQPSFTPTAKRLAVMDFHVLDCIGHLY